MIMDELKYYILSFSVFDKEPLQIIIKGLIDDKICMESEKIIDTIIELFNNEYIDASYCDEVVKYRKLYRLKKEELLSYVRKNSIHNFTEFQDEEYYFQTTEKSYELLKPEDRPKGY